MTVNALLLLALSLAWASEFLFIRRADAALPPLTVTAAMVAIGALALFAYVGLARRRPLLPLLRSRPLLCLVLAATTVAIPNGTVVFAEEQITAEVAALTGATMPVMTMLAAVFVTRQHPLSHLAFAGIAVALGGLVVFVGLGEGASALDAVLLRIAGVAVFTFGGIYASLKAADLDQGALTAWVMALAAVMLAVPALLIERPAIATLVGPGIGAVAAAGLISMAFAYLGYFALVERAGATFASLYAYLVPVASLLLGMVFLGETLTLRHLGGLALVLAGLWMIARGSGKVAPSAAKQPAAL
jgi:drug/metabolite transporter (DMT)-like permease